MAKATVLITALAASAVAMTPVLAQPTPLQTMDAFEMEGASDPRISPNGEQVAYVRHFADITTDERYSNIWIVGADGSGHEALTSGDVSESTPRWSPDGSRLAFISDAHSAGDDEAEEDEDGPAKSQIYVRDMTSGTIQMVSNLPESPAGIAWSPDGSQIAFTMLTPADPPLDGVLPEPPEGAEWQDPPYVTDKLVYRFDGHGYLPHGYHHIYVMPAAGGDARQISAGDHHHAGPGRRAGALSWTPDGEQIVISANRREDADLESIDTEVYAFSVADGAMTQLTDRRGADSSATVSPDGAWVAYTGFDDQRLSFQPHVLTVQSMDGDDVRMLTSDLDRTVHAFAWSPDSDGLYFAYDDQGVTYVAFVDLDGERRDVVDNVSGGSSASAYGGNAQFTVASDGRLAVVRADRTRPEDVWVGEADGEWLRVTDVNDDLFAERDVGAVEVMRFPSSHDGVEIQAWLVHPPGFDPEEEYPLFLEIHGGPFANYGERFDFGKQVVAGRGYLVLYVNPRGSTSYGAEFANLIHHDYPGDDFHDLMSAVDEALTRDYVDADRLYVGGGSGGGVLSSWVIGRTDRFKAAVIYYPVIDWESFNLTTDIPYIMNYWFPGVPWENRDHYYSRSLLRIVENVTTPSLLITGEADWRTPISQTEQYFSALKLRGVETVMMRIPDEPHGTRKYPSHHIARLEGTIAWMDQHP